MKRLFITAVVCLLIGLIGGLVLGRRLPPTREQVAEYLTNLSMSEFTDFAKRMNSKFGFPVFPQRILPVGDGEGGK